MGVFDWAEKKLEAAADFVAPAVDFVAPAVVPMLAPAIALGGQTAQLFEEDDGLEDCTPEVRDAIRAARGDLHSGLFDSDEEDAADAKKAVTTLTDVSDENKRGMLNMMSVEDVDRLIEDLPPGEHGSLAPLIEHCPDPEMKLKLWAAAHKQRAKSEAFHHEDAASAHLYGPDDDEAYENQQIPPGCTPETLAATRRNFAAATTTSEIDEEMAQLLEANEDEDGEPLTMAKVDALMARKQRELDLEMTYGINLTNDTEENIDDLEDDGDQDNRQRRTWSVEELDKLEGQLQMIPAEHRSGVKEFRRASVDYTDDGEKRGDVLAQAHWGDGKIEIFDSGAEKGGGVLIHEIGHNVDRNNQDAQKKYKDAVGWQDFSDEKSLRAQLAAQGVADIDGELAKLAGESAKGGYKEQAIEINGKMVQRHVDKDGKVTFSAYNADAIPRRGEAEKTNGGWQDEWDYGRTGPADLFADHYKLAARDPARLHHDMVAGPQQKIADLEEKIRLAKASGGDATALEDEKQRAEGQRDTLQQQFDVMRTDIYGVDDGAIEDFALEMEPEQADLFRAQAATCSTPDQIAKLQKLWAEGKNVDDNAVTTQATALPADQQAAFLRDAASCATPEQLAKLADAYKSGRRTAAGGWDPNKNSDEQPMLGY